MTFHTLRQATLVAIPKPGKRDRSSPRSYRLLALLSVLGKGLERPLAQKMVWIAIRHKLLHSQQIEAISARAGRLINVNLNEQW